jgi:hypothetical protein
VRAAIAFTVSVPVSVMPFEATFPVYDYVNMVETPASNGIPNTSLVGADMTLTAADAKHCTAAGTVVCTAFALYCPRPMISVVGVVMASGGEDAGISIKVEEELPTAIKKTLAALPNSRISPIRLFHKVWVEKHLKVLKTCRGYFQVWTFPVIHPDWRVFPVPARENVIGRLLPGQTGRRLRKSCHDWPSLCRSFAERRRLPFFRRGSR